MKTTRRNVVKRSLRLGVVAAGMGALTALGQRLLRVNKVTYPVGQDPAPGLELRRATRLIRPPGAIKDDDKFLGACIRCYRCQDACEPGAIQFFTEKDGKHYHTPYVDPAIKACEPCMKCTQVCPTNALASMTVEQRSQVRMATVEMREDLCLSYKAKRIRDEQAMMMELGRKPTESDAPLERRGPCGECYMFCPVREQAIKLEPGAFLAPLVFADECIGCGMCEEICRVMVRGEPAIRVVPIREWA